MFPRTNYVLAIVLSFAIMTMTATHLQAGEDQRTLLPLTAGQKTKVRSEMRNLLVSVSEIMSALSEKNMTNVEAAARKSGMIMVGQVEISLKKILTPTFMKLGKSVHVGFDQIADAARDGANQDKLVKLMAEQLNRCTTCHAAFGLR